MRIAVDIRDLQIARTGAKTYLEELCRNFKIVAPQHDFLFLYPHRKLPTDRSPLHKIWGHIAFYWWKEVQLPWLAWRQHCDLIFCADYVVPYFATCPAVPALLDAGFWRHPEHYNAMWRLLLNLFALPAARKAPVIITISEFAKRELVQYARLPAEKIMPIYLAPKEASTRKLSPAQCDDILARYGLTNKSPFILHVGVMEPRKNLPRLIEAFAQAAPALGEDYRLVLVGQPGPKKIIDDSSSIHRAINSSGLQEKIILTGYVPDEDLPAFYQTASFYALPSFSEGFALPVLEAFANDLPLMASNMTAIPEIAGDAALLFDPFQVGEIVQVLVCLAQDTSLRKELIGRGRQRLAEFSWKKTAEQTISVFECVVAGRKPQEKESSYERAVD